MGCTDPLRRGVGSGSTPISALSVRLASYLQLIYADVRTFRCRRHHIRRRREGIAIVSADQSKGRDVIITRGVACESHELANTVSVGISKVACKKG